MAIHFHQPVGNFDYVIEHAADKCYIPFLKTLEKYPEIKMTFHLSGCLLEWAERKRPEIIQRVRNMVKSGQVEVMGGAFYEAILPAIPERDRLRQIEMLDQYVKKTFEYSPKGAWVAERVWEPSLASVLSDAGVKYTILDDTHFMYAGVKKEDTYGFYVTEDNGKEVNIFPSDKELRYNIPFKMPNECMDYIRGVAERKEDPLLVYGDDGEKFGEWPGTHKWVYEEKWLENFFEELSRNSDWLKTSHLSECLKVRIPEGRVYLPTSSYEEMLEWALPADMQEQLEDIKKDLAEGGKDQWYKPFMRGGFWRNFLSKYPESNQMHKRMLYVSNKLEAMRSGRKGNTGAFKEAEKELFRAQCNCAYWHGVFGGLYLFHLRRAIYHHLIKSDSLLDDLKHGSKNFCEYELMDMDKDGRDEVILSNKDLWLCFSPAAGGALKELDSKNVCHNLINSLTRRKESYHRKIMEKHEEQEVEGDEGIKTIHDEIPLNDPEIKKSIQYDWYNRHSLIDHFISPDTDITSFASAAYGETGDFVNGNYDVDIDKTNKGSTLTMKRSGTVSGKKIELVKRVMVPSKGSFLTVEYTITNMEEEAFSVVFGPEINVTMPDADSERYSIVINENEKKIALGRDKLDEEEVSEIRIKDSRGEHLFNITLSEPSSIWYFPVKTVSQSEKAYELNYQSSVIFPHFKLDLEPREGKNLDIKIEV